MPNDHSREKRAPGANGAKPVPPRKGARRLFIVLLLMLTGAILATSLLANGQRNLRALFDRYGIDWLDDEAPPIPRGTRPLAGRQVPADTITFPSRFLSDVELAATGTFGREFRIRGEELCAAFDAAGIRNDGWKPGQFDPRISECLSETVLADDEADGRSASFFFIVKGTPGGEVASIRMKLMAPETDQGEAAHRLLVKALEKVIALTQWRDLAIAVSKAEVLEDFHSVRFGLSLRFGHEFSAMRNFNLVILPVSRTSAMTRSRAFFDSAGWIELPSAIARLPAFLLPHVVRTEPSSAMPPSP